MNTDQKYGFDVWGFIHLTRVLDGAELAACNQAFDPACGLHRDSFCSLLEHPVLTDCLKTICGDDYSMDQATELMPPGADPAARRSHSRCLRCGRNCEVRRLSSTHGPP